MSAASQARRRAADLDQPAFITVLEDADPVAGAQGRAARAVDGPLAGVAFAVKDNLDVAGVPTTAACPTLRTAATSDSTAVARLRSAGAVPIGKTNLDQFATGLVGTRSPYGACWCPDSPAHVSGGSSSGSAVAVATGVVPLALGTDTAGSGRVPAAFTGLVGCKPTRGLIGTTGLLPACRSLDCVTTLTRDVATARTALRALAGPDPADPYSRLPAAGPGVAARMRVIGVPATLPDLDDAAAPAWAAAQRRASSLGHVVTYDPTPLLAAAQLLYGGPWPAERLTAVGHLLQPDGPHLDPVVRAILLAAQDLQATAAFSAFHRLAELAAATSRLFAGLDAVLLPVTPGHPTRAAVAADPVGANSRLGTYTNMANLLDLCAVAVPAGRRDDGLPFGVQLLAPAFADAALLDLAARWCGEKADEPDLAPGRTLLAVAGAHLSDQPLNGQLRALGARLDSRSRTAPGYRMYEVAGALPRPGLLFTGDGPGGFEVELWDVPEAGVGSLLAQVGPPLCFGQVLLADGSSALGFLTESSGVATARNLGAVSGWREWLASRPG